MKILAGYLLVYAAIAAFFATLGRPNIDEGMFLAAGQRVAEGALPYRDFPFSQAPLLPYAFALAPEVAGSALLGGRLLSWIYGLLGMAAALWLARRVAGNLAAALTLLFSLASLPLLWVANSVRAQSVATPLLVGGAAALALPMQSVWSFALAPSLLLWSSGFRLTNLFAFAAVALWVAWRLRGEPGRLVRVVALVAVQAPLVFAPALGAAGDAWFHVIQSQLGRGARIGYIDSLHWRGELGRRLGIYSDLLGDAALLAVVTLGLGIAWVFALRKGTRIEASAPFGDPWTAQLALALLALLAFAPHLAFSTGFPSYLVASWALLAPAAGIGVATWLARAPRAWLRGAAGVGLGAAGAAAAALQWPIWIGSGESSLVAFRNAASRLAARHGPGCTALGFETHLIVEAGCRPMAGLEYSLFSYFPHLDNDVARSRGVLNPELLRERVAEQPPDWIALSPAHARILAGARIERRGRRLLVPEVEPLEALEELAEGYRYRARLRIPSGARRPGDRDTVPLWVYERR